MCYNDKMELSNSHFQLLNESNWKSTEYGLYYIKDQIKFIKISNKESLRDVINTILATNISRVGIICDQLSNNDLDLLREKKISYIVGEGEVKIFGKKETTSSNISKKYFLKKKLSPTLIVSPTGLEIVDTLMWLSSDQLECSPTHFSNEYKLSRPKLSHIMQAFEVKSLIELKEKLLLKTSSWWLEAFNAPVTKRKMTPSQTSKTRRYQFKSEVDLFEFEGYISELQHHGFEVELGGLSYLKLTKNMRMNDYDLLVKQDEISSVINDLNLKPAKKGDFVQNIYITPLIGTLHDERLKAITRNSNIGDPMYLDLNILRVLWGLNYTESRIQEQRKYLLEDYFAEAKTRFD